MTVSLAFEQIGEQGRALVLVHGWCCRRSHMEALARELAGQYRAFIVDLPGHGDTPSSESSEFESFAEALVGFLVEHDLSDVVLIGHSMGGVLSLMTAPRTDRVTGVVNIDGALPLTPQGKTAYADLFQAIRGDGYRATMQGFLENAFFLPHERGAVSKTILGEMLAVPEEQSLALLSQFPQLNAGDTLPNLQVPTLFLGADSPRFDESVVRELNPSIQIERLSGHGHFLQTFALAQVSGLIRGFLSSESAA